MGEEDFQQSLLVTYGVWRMIWCVTYDKMFQKNIYPTFKAILYHENKAHEYCRGSKEKWVDLDFSQLCEMQLWIYLEARNTCSR